MMRIMYTKLQNYSLCYRQSCIFVPIVKATTYLCNELNTLLCTKDHETHQAMRNLNRKFRKKVTLIWVSLLELLFNPLAPPRF